MVHAMVTGGIGIWGIAESVSVDQWVAVVVGEVVSLLLFLPQIRPP